MAAEGEWVPLGPWELYWTEEVVLEREVEEFRKVMRGPVLGLWKDGEHLVVQYVWLCLPFMCS